MTCLLAIQSIEVTRFPLPGSSRLVARLISFEVAIQSIEVALFPFLGALIGEIFNCIVSLSCSSMASSAAVSSDLSFHRCV